MKTHRFEGYVVEQIGRYKIIEGVGPWGGTWAARERGGNGELVEFNTRAEAQYHAHVSNAEADRATYGFSSLSGYRRA